MHKTTDNNCHSIPSGTASTSDIEKQVPLDGGNIIDANQHNIFLRALNDFNFKNYYEATTSGYQLPLIPTDNRASWFAAASHTSSQSISPTLLESLNSNVLSLQ